MYIYIGFTYACCYSNYHNNDNRIIMVRYDGVRPTTATATTSAEAVFVVYIFSSVGVVLLGNVKTLLFATTVMRESTGRRDRCPFRRSSVTLRTDPVARGVFRRMGRQALNGSTALQFSLKSVQQL